jgi:hypothetical protein
VVDQVYDQQPFPLEKRPSENLVPLVIPPTTTPPIPTTGKPCDLTPYLCARDLGVVGHTSTSLVSQTPSIPTTSVVILPIPQ